MHLALLLAAGLLDYSVGRVGYFVAKVTRYGFGVGAAGIASYSFHHRLALRNRSCAYHLLTQLYRLIY
jgi:hypothetical protein